MHAARGAPPGAEPRHAAAAAAYTVLAALCPGQAAALAASWAYCAEATQPSQTSLVCGTQVGDDVLGWRSGATPPFPSYPSGHATFGAACFEVLRRFIRHHDSTIAFNDGDIDPIGFTFTSDEFDGRNTDLRTGRPRPRVSRTYDSLWQAMVENSESRIWLGVHWRFDGISRQVGANAPEHGRPDKPGEVGPFGGVRLGMDIAGVIASERGFA